MHVLYYRVAAKGMIEIVRVLHERMEPNRHLDELPTEGDIRTRKPQAAEVPRPREGWWVYAERLLGSNREGARFYR